MQPYQLIKDHRTKVERGDVDKVLDGDLDAFIRAYLLYRRDGRPGREWQSDVSSRREFTMKQSRSIRRALSRSSLSAPKIPVQPRFKPFRCIRLTPLCRMLASIFLGLACRNQRFGPAIAFSFRRRILFWRTPMRSSCLPRSL